MSQHDLRHSYDVLRQHGNMSSPTIFFVLEKMMQEQASRRVREAGKGIVVDGTSLPPLSRKSSFGSKDDGSVDTTSLGSKDAAAPDNSSSFESEHDVAPDTAVGLGFGPGLTKEIVALHRIRQEKGPQDKETSK